MFFLKQKNSITKSLWQSSLFNEKTFYDQLIADISNCKNELLIESPYITSNRVEMLLPCLKKALDRKVKVDIITRDPAEHEEYIKYQATENILRCVELGINVQLIKGYFHRKLAILDNTILWEGSLNILSQSNSKEVMRRIVSKPVVEEMIRFIRS